MTRKHRILIVTPVFAPARGGIETMTLEIIRGLPEFDLRVVSLHEDSTDGRERTEGYEIRRYRNQPRGGRKSMIFLSLGVLIQTAVFRPHAIVSMHSRLSPACALASLAARARWVQIFHAREIAAWPTAATLAARRANSVLVVSSYTEVLFRRWTKSGRRVITATPGVTIAPAGSGPLAGLRRREVLTLGRMADWYKGFDVMIPAMQEVIAALPDTVWTIVGDGPLRVEIARRVEEAGISQMTTFTGRIEDAERDAILQRARVLALPSRVSTDGRDGEGFGIVYLEAAAAGTPSVAANEGGALDAVQNENTGLLVDPRQPTEVAAAIKRLLVDDRLADQMSIDARLWAEAHSWDRFVCHLRSTLA